MLRTRTLFALALIAGCVAFAAPHARALPALQIYSPDAVYDTSLESWIINDNDFELWVVGDVGNFGQIDNVDLAASFYGTSGSVTVSPLMGGPALAQDLNPDLNRPGYDGLLNHAEFANADGHLYWTIGDFTSTADAIQDYQPGQTGTSTGEIKKFMVHVSGFDAVHFDAFDHYYTGGGAHVQTHYVFAPFSHDATSQDVPAPGTLALFGTGFLGLYVSQFRKKR